MNLSTFKIHKIFAIFFLGTGVFALIGSIYTWGEGPIYYQVQFEKVWLPLADLIVTGPLSIISVIGLWKQKKWGLIAGLVTSGVYILGSVMVYIQIIWTGPPYKLQLVIPSLFGTAIALSYIYWRKSNL
ncbi:MAG: hypothetical protein SFY32_12330 [Bacteroidota bacterium]|nr:hypothetical protein [Bacteroidota bacterium]